MRTYLREKEQRLTYASGNSGGTELCDVTGDRKTTDGGIPNTYENMAVASAVHNEGEAAKNDTSIYEIPDRDKENASSVPETNTYDSLVF